MDSELTSRCFYSALLRDSRTSKSQDALKLLITTAQQKLDNTDHARLFSAIQRLYNSAVELSASLSPDIVTQLTSLSQSILSTFASQLRSADQNSFASNKTDTLQRVAILSAATRYRAQFSLKDDHKDLANTLCVKALKAWNLPSGRAASDAHKEQAACILLKWVIAQSDPSGNIDDMKSFFALWSAFAALLGKSGCAGCDGRRSHPFQIHFSQANLTCWSLCCARCLPLPRALSLSRS